MQMPQPQIRWCGGEYMQIRNILESFCIYYMSAVNLNTGGDERRIFGIIKEYN